MKRSFRKDNVQMFLGDGNDLLRDVVGQHKADVVIVDTPFAADITSKLFMLSSVMHAVKDDGVVVLFENESGWDSTSHYVQDVFRVFGRYYLVKNRRMHDKGAIESDRNIMGWLTPNVNRSDTWMKYGYSLCEEGQPGQFLKKAWNYSTVDQLGRAAGCKQLHTATKSLGTAGFILKHIASHMKRDILIADPYAGSGTFAIAANLLGMACVSSEIDKKTFANAQVKFTYAMSAAKHNHLWFKQMVRDVEKRVFHGNDR